MSGYSTELAPEQWARLGRRFGEIQARMVHEENSALAADEFYGEALRRLITGTSEFVTSGYVSHLLGTHNVVDRANLETARADLRKAREDHARKLGTVRADIASALRYRVEHGQAGGKYRAEGVMLAAQWIDPQPAASVPETARRAS